MLFIVSTLFMTFNIAEISEISLRLNSRVFNNNLVNLNFSQVEEFGKVYGSDWTGTGNKNVNNLWTCIIFSQ